MPGEEELLSRQMPHSTEAEQSVLGSMLIDARCVPEVIEALKPEDFYPPAIIFSSSWRSPPRRPT